MGRVSLFASACSVSIGLLLAGAAWAAPSGSSLADGSPVVAGAASSPALEQEREADALLGRAKAHFHAGEFREALPLVERALALTGSPRFLFNLGVLHHQLSQCVPAREYFERYLERDANGSAREQALVALEELNARCPAEASGALAAREGTAPPTAAFGAAASAPPAQLSGVAAPLPDGALEAPPERPPEVSTSPPPTALVLMGLGAAAGVASVVALALQSNAQGDIDALGSRAAEEGLPWDAYEVERQAANDDARLYRGLAIGLGAACAALVGAGATVWIVDANQSSSLQAAGVGVGYTTRF